MKRVVACPHCRGDVYLDIDVVARIGQPDDKSITREQVWRSSLTASQVNTLQTAKTTGRLKAFGESLSRLQAPPTDGWKREQAYLTFTALAVRREIPDGIAKIVRGWLNLDESRQLWALVANGTTAIVVDGRTVCFVPQAYLLGRSGKNITASEYRPPHVGELEAWLRTRYGYIPIGAQEFADEMRKKSIGEFATVRLDV